MRTYHRKAGQIVLELKLIHLTKDPQRVSGQRKITKQANILHRKEKLLVLLSKSQELVGILSLVQQQQT